MASSNCAANAKRGGEQHERVSRVLPIIEPELQEAGSGVRPWSAQKSARFSIQRPGNRQVVTAGPWPTKRLLIAGHGHRHGAAAIHADTAVLS
jgi:hypothetical protein